MKQITSKTSTGDIGLSKTPWFHHQTLYISLGIGILVCLLSIQGRAQTDTIQYNYSQISLSKSGNSLLYVRTTRNNQPQEIFMTDAKGTFSKKMASGGVPKWSPDETQFLYNAGSRRFFISGMDTSQKIEAFKNSAAQGPATAAFSPDGKSIVFSQGAPPTGDIYLLNINNREIKPVTTGPGVKYGAETSPDGKYIAYGYFSNANGRGIKVKNLATGEEKLVATFGEYPVWSHDGKSIAFFGHNNNEKPCHVYIVNADGNGFRQLTDGEADETPQWGRDDKKMYFVARNAGGLWEIWTINTDGTDRKRLVGNSVR